MRLRDRKTHKSVSTRQPPPLTATPYRAPIQLSLNRAIGSHAFGTLLEGIRHGAARQGRLILWIYTGY